MSRFFQLSSVLAACLVLSCSSSGSGDDETAGDADGTASLTQCTDTCDHLYNECGLVMVDNTDAELSESECTDSCDAEKTAVVDCLEDASCTDGEADDVDAVNTCFSEGDESDDTTDDTEEEEEDTDECDSDSDCGTCERCSDGSCRDCGEGPFGCYC